MSQEESSGRSRAEHTTDCGTTTVGRISLTLPGRLRTNQFNSDRARDRVGSNIFFVRLALNRPGILYSAPLTPGFDAVSRLLSLSQRTLEILGLLPITREEIS